MFLKLKLSILLCLVSVSFVLSQQSTAKLSEINQEWSLLDYSAELDYELTMLSKAEKIQMHLSLVERNLRKNFQKHLNAEKLSKRNQVLDILIDYTKSGVFPQNNYHSERTPYFIDHLGTHCAVGHLMMMTGYGEVAALIHSKNNYGYVRDLEKIYPQILMWAIEFGFTIDELAWIQPTYQPCNTECDITLQAFFLFEGEAPENYSVIWSNGAEGEVVDNFCPGLGEVSFSVVDENENEIPLSYVGIEGGMLGTVSGSNVFWIDESIGVSVEVEETNSASLFFCEGGATLKIEGENGVYVGSQFISEETPEIYWYLEDYCAGFHEISILSGGFFGEGWCQKTIEFYVPNKYWCQGDLNLDGMSTSADLTKFLVDFGCTENCESDINEDG